MMNDYSHWYHAGNVGDVWKHCAVLALLAARRPGRWLYLETHAGQGRYQLAPTGEWTEGAGRLSVASGTAPAAVLRYLAALEMHGFRAGAPGGPCYPGSPLLALTALDDNGRAVLFELAEPARSALASVVAQDTRAEVRAGDGLAALAAIVREAVPQTDERLVIMDPPYTAKQEWTDVPAALRAAHRADPAARFLLWYPIKSLTRPNAMLSALQNAGVPATALELITTPLELKRNRLNGSGLILVNAPQGLISELAAAAPHLGTTCATHQGRWSTRIMSWA